jgi:hypothetical protein
MLKYIQGPGSQISVSGCRREGSSNMADTFKK